MEREKLTITVNEAAKVLGIGRALAYEMVNQGKLPSLRFGRRILIPRIALQKLLGETSASNFNTEALNKLSGNNSYDNNRIKTR